MPTVDAGHPANAPSASMQQEQPPEPKPLHTAGASGSEPPGSGSEVKPEAAAAAAAHSQPVGGGNAADPSGQPTPAADLRQVDGWAAPTLGPISEGAPGHLGTAAGVGPSTHTASAGNAPPPKPQRTLWHPATGESLSGWKEAVSAAHEVPGNGGQQSAAPHGETAHGSPSTFYPLKVLPSAAADLPEPHNQVPISTLKALR